MYLYEIVYDSHLVEGGRHVKVATYESDLSGVLREFAKRKGVNCVSAQSIQLLGTVTVLEHKNTV